MKMKKAILLLAAILLLSVFPVSLKALAAYKVTVSAGLHGTFDGKEQIIVDIKEGDEWNPNNYVPTVTDDRYYFKGYHVSGIEGTFGGAQTITKDIVFVATYGIKGNLVAYYVNYVDEYGNELLPRATFHGNVGDKPVVAYRYIGGYSPQTKNYTGTLTEDEVIEFTFVYRRVATPDTIIEVEEGGGAGGAGGAAGPVTPSESESGAVEPAAPAEIIDIDEPTVPEAEPENNPDNGEQEQNGSNSIIDLLLIYGIPVLLGGLALLMLILFLLNRKRNDEES